MTATAQVLEKLSAIETRQAATDARIDALAAQRNTGAVPVQGPFIRQGKSVLSSEGFSFGRLIQALSSNNNSYAQDVAKNELNFAFRFSKHMEEAKGWTPSNRTSVLVPIWPEGLQQARAIDRDMYHEAKTYMTAGVDKTDADEVGWFAQKMVNDPKFLQTKAAATPAQSWIDQTLMGSFVPPPTFGPPIELLRNQEALLTAGATVIPLGPSGRISFPRLTQATQGATIGENTQQNPTQAGTGALTLSAKKSISVVVMPNELLRFASPAAEVLIRNDMMKTVALLMDKNLLEGSGGANIPTGLVTMIGNTSPTAGSYAVSGSGINVIAPAAANQMAPQDVYTFMGAIRSANGNWKKCSWILHPNMLASFYKTRWTPYSGGANQGGFVFDVVRGLGGEMDEIIIGRPTVATPQVSSIRGNGSQTYVICLQADDYYIGMFGAIEFTQTDAGYELLSSDQTAVRALLEYDGGPRHPGLVAVADALNFSVGP